MNEVTNNNRLERKTIDKINDYMFSHCIKGDSSDLPSILREYRKELLNDKNQQIEDLEKRLAAKDAKEVWAIVFYSKSYVRMLADFYVERCSILREKEDGRLVVNCYGLILVTEKDRIYSTEEEAEEALEKLKEVNKPLEERMLELEQKERALDLLKKFREIDKKEIEDLKEELSVANKAIECALRYPVFPADDKMLQLTPCRVGFCKGLAKRELEKEDNNNEIKR